MNLAIIQARMGSTRLPGKVLMPLCEKPMLFHIVKRLEQSSGLDQLMIATTNETEDDPVEQFCKEQGVVCYRGSTKDVLDRFYKAAEFVGVKNEDVIVRITADCPLVDPELLDRMLEAYQQSSVDYFSNVNPPTFPDGLDIEIFSFSSLQKAQQEAKLSSEREHVTLYIRNHPESFTMRNFESEVDFSKHRWTVDQPEDFEFIKKIYESLYPKKPIFLVREILALLKEQPWLTKENEKFQRNEGLLQSLQEDSYSTP